ncbi:Leucine-rich repeat and Endonuclease exonuclease phosphatase domain containing protein [Aphelenchoides besseyi]|nr:Leucine-rich repeat and Endonuclease exonuclease phosphatase domain containing protein [Aphelenchoides besseyi]KAI6195312.1 Leucine-rich repeat and Endonuclease exonuclease phosphatase domain containing protein [Aphelenchoides besseyi]
MHACTILPNSINQITSRWTRMDSDFDSESHLRFQNDWNGQQFTAIRIHGGVRNLASGIFDYHESLEAIYASHNLLTSIPPQIGRLALLTRLDLSFNSLAVLPQEIGNLRSLTELNLASNLFCSLPFELVKLTKLKLLDVRNNPLSNELQTAAENPSDVRGIVYQILSRMTVDKKPMPQRKWRTLIENCSESSTKFFVLSYNVLSDSILNNERHECPEWCTEWSFRSQQLIREIVFYNADIVALQEVEEEKFYTFFTPELKAHGYDGVFSSKSRSRTMSEEKRKRVDGCAMFWKSDSFQLRTHRTVEFSQMAISLHSNWDAMIDRVMVKDHVALIAVLETKDGIYKKNGPESMEGEQEKKIGRPLIISNVHVTWDPVYSDVKLIQTMMLLHECTKEIDKVAAEDNLCPEDVPMVLAGDFNSLPTSEVLDYLIKGQISKDHEELQHFHGSTALDSISSGDTTDSSYRHRLSLEAAMNLQNPSITNITTKFKATVDYILATPRSLQCLGFLKGVKKKWMKANEINDLPNALFPSDHIPVVAQYALK